MLHSGGYLSQSELVLTFGLGNESRVNAIEVDWPSGQVDRLTNVDSGQTITVQERGRESSAAVSMGAGFGWGLRPQNRKC